MAHLNHQRYVDAADMTAMSEASALQHTAVAQQHVAHLEHRRHVDAADMTAMSEASALQHTSVA